jgi:hypothetical protein
MADAAARESASGLGDAAAEQEPEPPGGSRRCFGAAGRLVVAHHHAARGADVDDEAGHLPLMLRGKCLRVHAKFLARLIVDGVCAAQIDDSLDKTHEMKTMMLKLAATMYGEGFYDLETAELVLFLVATAESCDGAVEVLPGVMPEPHHAYAVVVITRCDPVDDGATTWEALAGFGGTGLSRADGAERDRAEEKAAAAARGRGGGGGCGGGGGGGAFPQQQQQQQHHHHKQQQGHHD